MLDLVSKGTQILQYVLPILLFLFSSIMTYRLIKGAKEFGNAWSEFFKNPISLIFVFLVIGLTFFLYFKFIAPLLKGIGAS